MRQSPQTARSMPWPDQASVRGFVRGPPSAGPLLSCVWRGDAPARPGGRIHLIARGGPLFVISGLSGPSDRRGEPYLRAPSVRVRTDRGDGWAIPGPTAAEDDSRKTWKRRGKAAMTIYSEITTMSGDSPGAVGGRVLAHPPAEPDQLDPHPGWPRWENGPFLTIVLLPRPLFQTGNRLVSSSRIHVAARHRREAR